MCVELVYNVKQRRGVAEKVEKDHRITRKTPTNDENIQLAK